MSEISRLEQVTSWKRVLNAARRTIGREPLEKDPSDSWKAKILLAEHSPIRLLEFDWSWKNIKQWVTAHLVRHHEGCEKFIHSQRGDRRGLLDEYKGEMQFSELLQLDTSEPVLVFGLYTSILFVDKSSLPRIVTRSENPPADGLYLTTMAQKFFCPSATLWTLHCAQVHVVFSLHTTIQVEISSLHHKI